MYYNIIQMITKAIPNTFSVENECKYFHSNLCVCTDMQMYMSICLHNTVVDKMHNIPVKTMGLGP